MPAPIDHHFTSLRRSAHAAGRRFRVRVTDEHAVRLRIFENAGSDHVGKRVFRHHAARHGVNRARQNRQLRHIAPPDHFHRHAGGQLQIAVAPGRASAQIVGGRRDLGPEPADIQTEPPAQGAAFACTMQQSEKFLRFAQGKNGNKHGRTFVQRRLQGADEALLLRLARESFRHRTVPPRRLHDEHVDVLLGKFGRAHQRLVFEIDVPRVKNASPLGPDERTSRTQDVPRVEKFAGHRAVFIGKIKRPAEVDQAPLVGQPLHFAVGEKRIIRQTQLLALPHHHIDRIVQHHVRNGRRCLGHVHRGIGSLSHRQGQAADMILVRVGQHHGVESAAAEHGKIRSGLRPRGARMHARIKQDARAARLEQVAIGADFLSAREIGEFHDAAGSLPCARNRPRKSPATRLAAEGTNGKSRP